ncbi:hypothetical protein D3C81_994710 [compost metagenome]
MPGPLAIAQPLVAFRGLPRRQASPLHPREQEHPAIAAGLLPSPVALQQRADLTGQRQRQGNTRLGVPCRNEPLATAQVELLPTGHARLTDPRTVAKHQVGQHHANGLGLGAFQQLGEQGADLIRTHPPLFSRNGLGDEVGELEAGHRVAGNQLEPRRQAKRCDQHAEDLPHIGQRKPLLQRPDQFGIDHAPAHTRQGLFTEQGLEVLLDDGRHGLFA